MPIARFQMPDGRIARFEVPEGTTPEQAQSMIAQSLAPSREAPPIVGSTGEAFTGDPTQGMPWYEKAAAGAGKSLADTALGLRQLIGQAPQEEVAERARLDAPLMKTGAGLAGNIGGQIAQMAIPGGALARTATAARVASAVPRLAPYLGAGAQGATFAGAQPVVADDSRLQNVATGGLLGAIGQGAADVAGRAAGAIADRVVSPAVRALYERAQAAGIPVNTAQLSDSKFLKTLQSTLERIPFTGAQGTREGQQQAFNRAVSRTFGEDTPAVTRDVYAGAKARIGSEFERLSQQNNLAMSPELAGRLGAISEEASRFGTDDSARAVANAIDEVMGKAADGVVPGRAYQALDSKLGKLLKGGGEKAMYLGQVRDALRSAMDESITAADREAWQTARSQYKNLKTVRDLVAKEGADGNISPALLMGRVNATQAGKEANAMGRGGEMADLARIGRQFVRDPIPDSGTATRLATLGLLGGGAGVGYGKEGLSFDPTTALLAAGGAATLGRAANIGLNSEAGRRYLLGGGLSGLLLNAPRVAPTALPAGGLLYLSQ